MNKTVIIVLISLFLFITAVLIVGPESSKARCIRLATNLSELSLCESF